MRFTENILETYTYVVKAGSYSSTPLPGPGISDSVTNYYNTLKGGGGEVLDKKLLVWHLGDPFNFRRNLYFAGQFLEIG